VSVHFCFVSRSDDISLMAYLPSEPHRPMLYQTMHVSISASLVVSNWWCQLCYTACSNVMCRHQIPSYIKHSYEEPYATMYMYLITLSLCRSLIVHVVIGPGPRLDTLLAPTPVPPYRPACKDQAGSREWLHLRTSSGAQSTAFFERNTGKLAMSRHS
jgi:hypothetical protein